MKGKSIMKWAILLATLVLVLTLIGARWAGAQALAGEAIDWWVFAGGGAPSAEGSIFLDDTLGQPLVGGSSGSDVTLGDGFWYGSLGPPRVTLTSFAAQGIIRGAQLSWVTSQETDLLGFNLYRSASPVAGIGDPGTLKLNPSLIPAKAAGQPSGAQYGYLDSTLAPGTTGYYWLELVTAIEPLVDGPRSARAQYGIYLPLIRR
jgi:hypothetical protein